VSGWPPLGRPSRARGSRARAGVWFMHPCSPGRRPRPRLLSSQLVSW